MSDPHITPALDNNKADGAGGTVLIGGILIRVLAHFVNAKWPGAIDVETMGDLSILAAAGLGWYGAYAMPHST